MQKTFKFFLQLDEHAEVGDLGDVALDDLTWQIVLGDASQPRIFGQLLQTKGYSHLVLID